MCTSLTHHKPLDYSETRQKLERALAVYELKKEMFDWGMAYLRTVEGQVINKRIGEGLKVYIRDRSDVVGSCDGDVILSHGAYMTDFCGHKVLDIYLTRPAIDVVMGDDPGKYKQGLFQVQIKILDKEDKPTDGSHPRVDIARIQAYPWNKDDYADKVRNMREVINELREILFAFNHGLATIQNVQRTAQRAGCSEVFRV